MPLPTREELGIREVDAAEAFAAAGLTHGRYEAGEEVPWDPGLFLLETTTGAVEAWVVSLASVPEQQRGRPLDPPDIAISPSNRFLQLSGAVYDRQSGRAYRLAGPIAGWWGYGSDERLLVRAHGLDTYVTLDGDLEPVAQFRLPPGELVTSPLGGYILVHQGERGGPFHLVNLEDEARPQAHTWELPWEPISTGFGELAYRIDLLDGLVAFVGRLSDSACRVTRYDLQGTMLSDQSIPCGFTRWAWWDDALPRVSPDGGLIAVGTSASLEHFAYDLEPVGLVVTIFDTVTGAEVVRILGAHPPWIRGAGDPSGNVWLSDGSGIIVQTRDGRLVAEFADGASWSPAPGLASPDAPDLFLHYGSVTNARGEVQASLSFGPPGAAILDPPLDATRVFWEEADLGVRSDTVRIRTSLFYRQEFDDYSGRPPFDPVIELPPFGDALRVAVVADTCLNVRREPSLEATIVECLTDGAVVELAYFEWQGSLYTGEGPWMHIRTEDGVEGWAHADYLRWHSDGVRLEE